MEDKYKRLNEINLHRLSVRVKWEGRTYDVCELVNDAYGQPERDESGSYVTKKIGSIKALYSTSHSYVQKQSAEAAITKSKQTPMIFCDYVYAKNEEIKINTIIKIDNVVYKVIELTDIYMLGVLAQVSLEVYSDGDT